MSETVGLFTTSQPTQRRLQWGDGVVFLGVVVVLYLGVALAVHTPPALRGPDISLDPQVLPYYAGLSIVRMAAAYLLSLLFALWYGRAAARNLRVEHVLMPLLDVLQSVPILSFLPVVLLSLSAVLPQQIAAELAAIVLIFTSQAWNLVFAWYQALKTIPHELDEASSIFRFNGWLRFRRFLKKNLPRCGPWQCGRTPCLPPAGHKRQDKDDGLWHRAFQLPLPWERVGVRGFMSQKKASGPLTLALARRERGQHKCFWDRFLELNLAPMPQRGEVGGGNTWTVSSPTHRRLRDHPPPGLPPLGGGHTP